MLQGFKRYYKWPKIMKSIFLWKISKNIENTRGMNGRKYDSAKRQDEREKNQITSCKVRGENKTSNWMLI